MSDYAWLDKPIALRRDFIKLLDHDFRAAAFLSQAVYWQLRESDEEGWWWKTSEQWGKETCIPPRTQRRLREKLREREWWQEDRRGMPAKLYFRVDMEALDEDIDSLDDDDEADESPDRPDRPGKGGQTGRQDRPDCPPRPASSADQDRPDCPVNAGADNAGARFEETNKKRLQEETKGEEAPAPAPEHTDLSHAELFALDDHERFILESANLHGVDIQNGATIWSNVRRKSPPNTPAARCREFIDSKFEEFAADDENYSARNIHKWIRQDVEGWSPPGSGEQAVGRNPYDDQDPPRRPTQQSIESGDPATKPKRNEELKRQRRKNLDDDDFYELYPEEAP